LPQISPVSFNLQVRVSKKFGWDISPFTYDQAIVASHQTLAYLNNSLAVGASVGQMWLVEGEAPSIADIAVFPYVAFAEHSTDNEILLSQYPAVVDWLTRFKSLPNYLPLPGI
jgi:glutathione S-transferase